MIKLFEYTILFAVIVLFQVLLVNNIHIGSFVILNISVLYIILLPLDTSPWLVLILAALIGITIDAISGLAGINTIATTLLGFIRRPMIDLFLGKREETERGVITSHNMGFTRFIIFTLAMILIQNSVIFTLETLSFDNFHLVMLRIIASTIGSTLLVYIFQVPLFRGAEFRN